MRRRVLVTGAGSGIGLATFRSLSAAGFDVVALVRDEGTAEALHRRAGRQVEVLVVDLADVEARRSALDGLEFWGLVNNAGYMNAGLIEDVPIDDARRQFEVMVMAPLHLVQLLVPPMIGRGQGRIVNITSSALHTSTPLTPWYVAAKAALRELTDSLRTELAGTGVDVVDVEPGAYATAIWERAEEDLRRRKEGSRRPDLYDRVLGHMSAEGRAGRPEEVGERIALVMTQGDPARHVRIGPGAGLLRAVDTLVPDAVWDRAVTLATRAARR